MSFHKEMEDFLTARDSKGFVVFSSTAPIVARFASDAEREIRRLTDLFVELSAEVNVLMPSFPRNNTGSITDLDQEPSTNGILAESFRLRFPKNRTVSRFFPFTVSGPDAETLFALRPEDVWGDKSLYWWIESNNLDIVTIGLPPYVCSVQHRAEHLNQNLLPYREQLQRAGEVLVRGERGMLRETLLARKKGVDVDFRPISPLLQQHGQRISKESGILLSSMSAKKKITLVSDQLKRNPVVFACEG